jgi:hypothetical protein
MSSILLNSIFMPLVFAACSISAMVARQFAQPVPRTLISMKGSSRLEKIVFTPTRVRVPGKCGWCSHDKSSERKTAQLQHDEPFVVSFRPSAVKILAAGQNPVNPIWNRLKPTKAVSQSQLAFDISICAVKWANTRLVIIMKPAKMLIARLTVT